MRAFAPALLLVVALAPALAGPARAEIAVLTNGQTLKVSASRPADGLILLSLREGGEVGLPREMVLGLVPDEIVDEIAAGEGDLRELARAAAVRYGLEPDLVLAVVSVESGFAAKAVSRKGAQGLMQLMPATAAELGVGDSLDAAQNLDGGARHLQALLRHYRGDLRRALAAYNAGAGAVARHGGVPPYRETQEYVRKVLLRYGASRREPAAR